MSERANQPKDVGNLSLASREWRELKFIHEGFEQLDIEDCYERDEHNIYLTHYSSEPGRYAFALEQHNDPVVDLYEVKITDNSNAALKVYKGLKPDDATEEFRSQWVRLQSDWGLDQPSVSDVVNFALVMMEYTQCLRREVEDGEA